MEVLIHALASPSGRGTSRREGERDVQTVRVKNAVRTENRCGEPSQALRASSPGGRAKALSRTSICATMEGFIYALASPSGRGTSRREGERDRADSSWRNAVSVRNWCGGSVGSL